MKRKKKQAKMKTFPIPIGVGTMMDDLANGAINAARAMMYLLRIYRSYWDHDVSHARKNKDIAKDMGVSESYASRLIRGLGAWLSPKRTTGKGTEYTITKRHADTDADAPTQTCAAPHGKKSPMGKMISGTISWKACLLCHVMKINSDWSTGVTHELNISLLAQLSGLGTQTVIDCLKELTDAKLIKRISGMREPGRYQLYPIPPKQKEKVKKDPNVQSQSQYNETEGYLVSRNWQCRIKKEDGTCEIRVGRNEWKEASESDRWSGRWSWLFKILDHCWIMWVGRQQFQHT